MSPSVYLSVMSLVPLALACGLVTKEGRSCLRASFRLHPVSLALLAAVMILSVVTFAGGTMAVPGLRLAQHVRGEADIPVLSCYAFFGCSIVLGLLLG